MATTSSGNVVVAGFAGDLYGATLTVGSYTFTLDGGSMPTDGAPAVPGPAGGFVPTLDPRATCSGSGGSRVRGHRVRIDRRMGLDSSGDIYVAGRTGNPNSSNAGFFVAKLDTTGQTQWTRTYVPSAEMYANPGSLTIAAVPAGAVAVLGVESASQIFGVTADPNAFTGFVLAVDATGQTQYTKTFAVPSGRNVTGPSTRRGTSR